MSTGWKCPECGKCYAPHVNECASCNAVPKRIDENITYDFDGYKIRIVPTPVYEWPFPYWSIIPHDPNVTYPTYTFRDVGLPSPEYRVTCGSN